ncbi:flagellar hook-basal body complex protein FliE [Paenibacillus sp. P96]|uniref:Flagellar hook-basal body complex protein FliE n=1 Tax=Paenibacillus zeirhizosphaerae TaxID=2987519 RepID=A0ABT9FS41_9BACL|nr:flagellar hook-basal body complex protein FliE [Paenibacillus sp. P96]MDP4097547.1 flagellar hook-basal body complex protein FliE [Paenibacillus sp. P96]
MIQNTMFNIQSPSVQQAASLNNSKTQETPAESLRQFGAYLEDALNQVNQQEINSQEMSNKFLIGQVDVDQVMIASQEALLSLQFTTQIRNKAIEAYQEIMRTQL